MAPQSGRVFGSALSCLLLAEDAFVYNSLSVGLFTNVAGSLTFRSSIFTAGEVLGPHQRVSGVIFLPLKIHILAALLLWQGLSVLAAR